MGQERVLQSPAAGGRGFKTLHRHHRLARYLAERDEASANRTAVKEYGTGAAVAGVAADLDALQAEFVAQDVR